jgi:hypothetical protein
LPGIDLGASLFNGRFQVTGGNKKDEELYEYLMLTNYNKDSVLGEDRDDSVEPLFGIIDTKADAIKTTSRVQDLKKALDLAVELDETAGRELGASLNWSSFKDWTELQAKIVDFASKEPIQFLKYAQDPSKSLKSIVKSALDTQVIGFNPANGEVKLGDNLLVVLGKKEAKNILESMVLWFNTANNGQEVLALIKEQLAGK